MYPSLPDIALIGGAFLAIVASAILFFRNRNETERLKYEFITIIAHKFRTPLTQTRWILEGMLKDEKDPFKEEGLSEIAAANDSLIKLTGTLIELTDSAGSAKSAYDFELVDLCALAKEAVETQRQAFHEKNQFVSVACSEESIIVRADRARLGFVLDALLSNARAYTAVGKNVSIEVSANRRRAVVAVRDEGMGMSEAEMKRLFEKFFRSERARSMDTEGFGVGLYLAQSIVKRHKGKLIPFSEGPGRGSTFSVALKRAR